MAPSRRKRYNRNNSIIVRGINGTSVPRFRVHHLKWRFIALIGRMPRRCATKSGTNMFCNGHYEATAHVRQTDRRRSEGQRWYLVPLCKSCNNSYNNGRDLALRHNARLVKVKKARAVPHERVRQVKRRFRQVANDVESDCGSDCDKGVSSGSSSGVDDSDDAVGTSSEDGDSDGSSSESNSD